MKLWILSESQFGNGRILAKKLAEYSDKHEVMMADLKEVDPITVAKDKPDAIIVGGAIRMFRGAPKTKKWVKNLNKILKENNWEINYGAGFITHGLPTEKVSGWVKRYLSKIESASAIQKVYPTIFTGKVVGQEGPFENEVLDDAKKFVENFFKWMN